MTDPRGRRSVLPWILFLSAAAGCILCMLCGTSGVALVLVSRPAALPPAAEFTAAPSPSTTPTAETGLPADAYTEPPPLATAEALTPTVSNPDPDSWRVMGDPDAPVRIEEFGDFQCPYCARFFDRAEGRLREEFIAAGKVLFIYRNFLVVDSFADDGYESRLSALGALCAGEQGMFWEYHDLLFENQDGENEGAFSASRLRSFASELEMDADSFARCLEEERYADILRADKRLAREHDINAVPSFLINGKVLIGPDEEEFFTAVEEAVMES